MNFSREVQPRVGAERNIGRRRAQSCPLSALRLLDQVVDDKAVLALRAEHRDLGVCVDPDVMTGWPIEKIIAEVFTADRAQPGGVPEIHESFEVPDEVRRFPNGRLEIVTIGGATIGRAVFEPGWRWATSVQPIAKTKSCEAAHFQYHVAGVLRIRMDDGSELDCRPGDVSLLPAGHDAWVVGSETAVVVDFQGMADYARTKGT